MKIAFLSGAYKNAGDFLIEQRAANLLRALVPQLELKTFLRRELSEHFDEINATDAIVFSGGPIYMENISHHLPAQALLAKATPPLMFLGGGWGGMGSAGHLPYRYRFSPESLSLLSLADTKGYGLGCRDIHTYKALHKEGFSHVYMTGCPAWYDLAHLPLTHLQNSGTTFKKIYVSDCAYTQNLPLLLSLVQYLKKTFPAASIVAVFHRGTGTDKETPAQTGAAFAQTAAQLRASGIEVKDISYGSQGFEIYNDGDLHIGFRVHAHIYNLSLRRRTLLIEEDGRGGGVNQSLGLLAVKAFNEELQTDNRYANKLHKLLRRQTNPYFLNDVDCTLQIMADTHDKYLENAFAMMQEYYTRMRQYILQLCT